VLKQTKHRKFSVMAIRTWGPRRPFDRPWIQPPPFDVLCLRGNVRDGAKCNGCGLDLHVVCGLKDERPGSASSQAWCQSGNVAKKCYPPGKCPDFLVPLDC
jgi:hypothetical protein